MPTQRNKLAGTTRAKALAESPRSDGDGDVSGVLHILREISTNACQPLEGPPRLERERQLLRTFIENSPAAMAMFDCKMRYLAASQRWLLDYGLGGRNVVGCSHYDIFPEISESWKATHQRALAGEVLRADEDRFERADGSIQWLRWELQPWFNGDDAVGGIVIFTEDITARRHTEQLLQKANHTLAAIRDCHEAMLRAGTERELLDEICRIIVQSGERMTWVGYAEENSRKGVRVAAAAGVSENHLKDARVNWARTTRGRGPVGTAIRTGKPSYCQNTQTDPNFAPWRESAKRHGFGCVIALPLLLDKKCYGALAIYAPEPDAFDAGEQLMLTDLANDLAFGINSLRLRAERERLENEILISIEREQERIGRDLHDGLCQLLVGAKFRSVYLQKISAGRKAAVQEARSLEEMLNHAIQQARDLARGLNPVKIAPAGLMEALQKLADDAKCAHRIHCFCQFPKPVKVSDHHAVYHLYRIAQEAVQNAIKHARPKNISITLTREKHLVSLTVKDDGIGMPEVRKRSGMGLDNMEARARIIGARLEIRRRRLGGTAVSCGLPVKNRKQP